MGGVRMGEGNSKGMEICLKTYKILREISKFYREEDVARQMLENNYFQMFKKTKKVWELI